MAKREVGGKEMKINNTYLLDLKNRFAEELMNCVIEQKIDFYRNFLKLVEIRDELYIDFLYEKIGWAAIYFDPKVIDITRKKKKEVNKDGRKNKVRR